MQALSFGLVLSGAIIDLDGTFLIQLAIFFALFGILSTFLFKPLLAVFDEREKAIDGAKDSARDLEKSADEKFKKFETEMKKVKVEANAERDRIQQEGVALERDLLAKSRTEADKILRDAEADLARKATEIRGEMKNNVPALAADIAAKLLGRRAS
ncbi:MAG: ATP synthase F0 subunit B [Deltaproteobacteria bacterium]|nr:ATP synthase F0 subunit B [Deltaproteobacteria bacterium]